MTYRKLALLGGGSISRSALTAILCIGSVTLMAAKGCNQNTPAALVGIAGTAIATVETIEGHSDLAATLQKDFGAAQTAVLNWKSGTPTQDVAQALQLVESDLNLLPVSQQDQVYIELAASTLQNILLLFPGNAPRPAALDHAWPAPANTAEDFKAKFNALVATHPIKGLKPLE